MEEEGAGQPPRNLAGSTAVEEGAGGPPRNLAGSTAVEEGAGQARGILQGPRARGGITELGPHPLRQFGVRSAHPLRRPGAAVWCKIRARPLPDLHRGGLWKFGSLWCRSGSGPVALGERAAGSLSGSARFRAGLLHGGSGQEISRKSLSGSAGLSGCEGGSPTWQLCGVRPPPSPAALRSQPSTRPGSSPTW